MNLLSIFLAIFTTDSVLLCLLWLAIAAVVFFLFNWGITYIGITEPFLKPMKLIIVVVVIVFIINALLTLAGHPFIAF